MGRYKEHGTHGDFALEVAKGNVPGHVYHKAFGENPEIAASDGFCDLWAGDSITNGTQKIVAPTQPRLHGIRSSDAGDVGTLLCSGIAQGGSLTTIVDYTATFVTDGVTAGDVLLNDTQVALGRIVWLNENILMVGTFFDPTTGHTHDPAEAGDAYRVTTAGSTGGQVIHVRGTDALYADYEEFVILNGTANVMTLGAFSFINRMAVYGSGSNRNLEGDIRATALTDGTVTASIFASDNQTMQAIWRIPAGHFAVLLNWNGSVSKKTAGIVNMRIKTGQLGDIMYLLDSKSINSVGTSVFTEDLGYQRIPFGTDVLIEATTDATMGVAGGFTMLIIEEAYGT